MTDAQETSNPSIDGIIASWRSELDGQVSVSASDVQGHLFELWGQMEDGDRRTEVERWLTETLARQLYAVDDIDARLDRVLAGA